MSVIFGKFNFDGRGIEEAALATMQERLNHWGADRVDVWLHKNIGFGHLQLYNTTQSLHEKLPFYDSLNDLAITADARIDNREELIKKLDIKREETGNISDSLIILKLYQKYGTDCLKHLLGDFAFAIYDGKQHHLFLGRDHLGVKPLFYYQSESFFAFASEKKGILSLPDVNQKLNYQFLYNHLVFPTEQSVDTTLYEHLKKLKPAHSLTINLSNHSQKLVKYWEPDVETELKFKNREDYYEGLREQIELAVKCRSISDFKVGVELSGGMDSSVIASIAHSFLKENNKGIVTLSNTLSESVNNPEIIKLDERQYIDAMIDFCNIDEKILITEPAFRDIFDEYNFSLEVNDGFERWNPLWQIPLKKAAKINNIRTLLSGFPGDELITYRGKYYFLDYLDKKQYFKYLLAKKKYHGFHKVEPLLPFNVRSAIATVKHKLGFYSKRTALSFETFNIPKYYKEHLRDCLWHDPYFQEQFKSYRHFQRYRILKPQVTHRMESETRYGIYFRTEPRFPMADIRLIQYYLSMPNELKYEGELARTAYRKAIGKYLPEMILKRDSKYGSIAPFLSVNQRWKQEQVNQQIEELPNLKLLKKDMYLKSVNQNSNADKKNKNIPPIEILLWINRNKELLEREGL